MTPRYFELLRTLCRGGVDFIVVGGVAAILEGVPITTLDLDVVVGTGEKNLDRLTDVLASIDARYRDPAGRRIVPDRERLATIRTNLLLTDLGPLDVLTEVGEESGYADLLPFSRVRRVEDLEIRVLGLAKLIEIKEAANREKDRAMLPVLRRTLELAGEE